MSLCDRTTNMVKAGAEAGYACYRLDNQRPPF